MLLCLGPWGFLERGPFSVRTGKSQANWDELVADLDRKELTPSSLSLSMRNQVDFTTIARDLGHLWLWGC